MSQLTGGSHFPTAASGGSGSIRKSADVTVAPPAIPPATKVRAYAPVPCTPRSANRVNQACQSEMTASEGPVSLTFGCFARTAGLTVLSSAT